MFEITLESRTAPHRSGLHVAVTDSKKPDDATELLAVRGSFHPTPKVGVRDYLQKWHTGPIQVHQRVAGPGQIARSAMDILTGILLQMSPAENWKPLMTSSEPCFQQKHCFGHYEEHLFSLWKKYIVGIKVQRIKKTFNLIIEKLPWWPVLLFWTIHQLCHTIMHLYHITVYLLDQSIVGRSPPGTLSTNGCSRTVPWMTNTVLKNWSFHGLTGPSWDTSRCLGATTPVTFFSRLDY